LTEYRSIAELRPPEDGSYQVFAMPFASSPRRVHDNFMVRDMHDGPMPADYFLWILRSTDRTVLVDTGFGARASAERGRPRQFDPVDGLRQIGVDPDSIEDVVISHLHYDHAGNIDRFARARFHIQDNEVAFSTGRHMCNHALRATFDVEDVVTLVRRTYAERVVFHDGDDALLPGLTLHAFPGHSAAVQAVLVRTQRGPVLVASDAVHYFANILSGKPFMLTLSAPDTLQSYARIRHLCGSLDNLIPGHDPAVRSIYPSITINGIELIPLHEPPRDPDYAALARLAVG